MKKFNWLTFLKKVIKHAPNARTYRHNLILDKAGNWPTCACGQLCRKLPRKGDGEPEDYQLSALGMQFYSLVNKRHWRGALRKFYSIEKRSALLLRRQAKKL